MHFQIFSVVKKYGKRFDRKYSRIIRWIINFIIHQHYLEVLNLKQLDNIMVKNQVNIILL